MIEMISSPFPFPFHPSPRGWEEEETRHVGISPRGEFEKARLSAAVLCRSKDGGGGGGGGGIERVDRISESRHARSCACALSPFVSFFSSFSFFSSPSNPTIGRSTIVRNGSAEWEFSAGRAFPRQGESDSDYFSIVVVENRGGGVVAVVVVVVISGSGGTRRGGRGGGEGKIRLGIIKWLRGDLASMDRQVRGPR